MYIVLRHVQYVDHAFSLTQSPVTEGRGALKKISFKNELCL